MNKIELTKDMDNQETSFPSTPEQEIDTKKLFGIIHCSTVSKIYTPIFSFLRKRVVNIAILELVPVSNERYGNF